MHPIVPTLHVIGQSGARAYGDHSPQFRIKTNFLRGCCLSPFLSDFLIPVFMLIYLSPCENSGVHIYTYFKLSDLEWTEEV